MTRQLTAEISVYGKVQGVGFRPLVCRLTKENALTGSVRNAGTHVEILVTGEPEQIEKLCESLRNAALPVHVENLVLREVPLKEFATFTSVPSTESKEVKLVSADIGICSHCLQELKEKGNRRQGYSYISCAQCGPRYTIIRKLPYDRVNTTMDQFALCDDCAKEYADMQNHRGHGETISCYHCGPQLQCIVKEEYKKVENVVTVSGSLDRHAQDKKNITLASELLKQGQIIMVKAVGGFNLACRADKVEVVTRLRDLKKRMSKPFAVMVSDVALAEKFCYISAEEKSLLQSAARPIVLLQKKESKNDWLAENVTDVSDQVGVFLPSMGFYSKLDVDFPFIVTSCNYTGQPIIFKDEEAQRFFAEHANIAAMFTYEREILRPADDAVTRIVNGKVQVLRRTKGYMPEPVVSLHTHNNFSDKEQKQWNLKSSVKLINKDEIDCLQDSCHKNDKYEKSFVNSTSIQVRKVQDGRVLAVGAQMEPGFCLTAEGQFFPAEIPGNISLEKTENFYADSVNDWTELLSINPRAVVGDLHPGYTTTQWGKEFAEKNRLPFYQVQHHHAHALSVMAEHKLTGKVLAACFDGTGFGTDGTVWGGEFLLCEGSGFTRVGHLKTIPMLGGDVSMQQAWKIALCHLATAGLHSNDLRLAIVQKALQLNVNVIRTSSMGRLFDAASSLLGLADFNSHQGRCAMALESAARSALMEKTQPLSLAFAKEEVVPDEDENKNDNTYKEIINENDDAEKNLKKVIYDPTPLWKALLQIERERKSICAAALGFHYAVVDMVTDMAELMAVNQVALTGGCFANRILLETCTRELQKRGFQVFYNEAVSPGDGGISLGQAYYGLLKHGEMSFP